MSSPCASRHGWHALPPDDSEVVHDGLFIQGMPCAIVQAFYEGGPFYANALTPDGDWKRLGAGESHSSAAEWCERITGYRVGPRPRGS